MSYEVWFEILKSRDLFGENIVAARLGGRSSSFDGFMTILHKLRNLHPVKWFAILITINNIKYSMQKQ
ncbi:MAG: hypothetical protein ACUZ8I_10555 [Candidatus Scalindua sp.]